MDSADIIKLAGALFALMNPLTNLPVFLSLMDGATTAQQRNVAVRFMVYALGLGIVFAAFGSQILNLFGISVDDLRVAGGITVLIFAFSMLNGTVAQSHHGSASEQAEAKDLSSVAFYPLAFPIIVGPGTITTLIVFSAHGTGLTGLVALIAVFGALVGLLGVTFFFAANLGTVLKPSARVIMSRLMGMILAAIAIDMIATGLKVLLPGLAGS